MTIKKSVPDALMLCTLVVRYIHDDSFTTPIFGHLPDAFVQTDFQL